jgi:hypothetical protein
MPNTAEFNKCLTAAQNALSANESLVQFRLGDPIMGRPDYITRYKAYVGVLDPSNTSVTSKRIFLITLSSNTQQVGVDTTTDPSTVTDIW